MQDVGAPSNNATGSGLAPIQSAVSTTRHQWKQDVVYASNVEFIYGATDTQVEQYLQFTLRAFDDLVFSLINMFQTYQINNISVTFGVDRIQASASTVGRAIVFAVAPYNRTFDVAINTRQSGLISTLPGSTWSFCNSFDDINSTGSTDLQRIVTSSVTPQYEMSSDNGTNYSNRPLSIRGDDGLDDTVWRGFNLFLTRSASRTARTFTIPTIVKINVTFQGIRLLRSVPSIQLVGPDYLFSKVNEKRDSYIRPTDTVEGVGNFRITQQSNRRASSSCPSILQAKPKRKSRKKNNISDWYESKMDESSKTQRRRYTKRCNKKIHPLYEREGRSLKFHGLPFITNSIYTSNGEEEQENKERDNPGIDNGREEMLRDMQYLPLNDREDLQACEVSPSQDIQD